MKMNFEITDNGLKIIEETCWACGSKENITSHHLIPKYLEPQKNAEIPLCWKCHQKLHGQDMNGILAFTYKIFKTLKEGVKRISSVQSLIEKKRK